MTERSPRVTATFVDRFQELHGVGYRASFAILGRRVDAEDCAQEALARVMVKWKQVHDYAPAFTARVATNLALDRARRVSKTIPAAGLKLPDSSGWVDQMAERRHDLVAALQALPKRQREAVALRYLADLPEAQTASAMGCTIGTVKSTTAKGLQRLRLDLGPRWAWGE